MLIEDGDGRFTWRCDDCGRSAQAEGNFLDCWNALKRRGWVAIRDGTWFHTCARCRRPSNARAIMSRIPLPASLMVPPPTILGEMVTPTPAEVIDFNVAKGLRQRR
jgi:hypothetical protein